MKRTPHASVAALAILVPLLLPIPALAGEAPPGAPPDRRPPFLCESLEVETLAARLFSGSLRNGPGKVETDLAGVGLRYRRPVAERALLGVEAGWEWRDYSFDDASGILEGVANPLRSLHTLGAAFSWLQLLGDDWRDDWQVYARGRVQAGKERGAGYGDGLTWSGLAVAGREFAPGLRLGFGVAGASRLEDRTRVYPAVQLVWEVSDTVTARLEGPELAVEVELGGGWDLALLAGWETRRFRLRDGGPGQGGVFADERIPVKLRLAREIGRDASLEVFAGLDAWRELELIDRDGHRTGRARVRPAPFAGFALSVRFGPGGAR